MRNIFSSIRTLFLFVLLLIPVEMQAQDWWNTNSLKLDSLQTGTLFHATGQYGFSHMTGNVNLTAHQGAPQLFLRNGRFMAIAYGQINYQKIQTGDNPATRTETFTLNTKLIYDLQRHFQTETGMLWERNEPMFIDRRIILYQGLIFNAMENENFGSMLFGAAGYQWATSTEFLPLLPVTREDKAVAYLQQQLAFKFLAPFSLVESFSIIKELDDNGAYRTDLSFSAQMPLSRKVVFVVTHQTKYESEPIILELAPHFEKFNTSLTLGVQFTF